MTKLCKDCEYFHIVMLPLRSGGAIWDLGQAECKKYNLVVDFANKAKLNKLTCIGDKA